MQLNLNPVPAENELTVQLVLEEQALVELILFDTSGRAVEVVWNDILASGSHSIQLSLEELPSGTYLLRAVTRNEVCVRKLVVLRSS